MAGPSSYVGVVGPGDPAPDAAGLLEAAERVGAGLGAAGCVVVCGGLGGVMSAACRGARQAGGTTVGLLPGATREGANPYLTVALPTGLGEVRNALVVRSAEVVIALGGAYGTLSEVALALRAGTPVVGLGTWRLVRPDGEADSGVIPVAGPEEAVEVALALVSRGGPVP